MFSNWYGYVRMHIFQKKSKGRGNQESAEGEDKKKGGVNAGFFGVLLS